MEKRVLYDMMELISEYGNRAVFLSAAVTCLSFVLYFIYYAIRRKFHSIWLFFCSLFHALIWGCFAGYLYLVLAVTLLSRIGTHTKVIDLELFSTFTGSYSSNIFLIENVLMFVPYSVLLFLNVQRLRKWYWMLPLGLGSSMLIEYTQYNTGLGLCQIDDVLTNTVGMMAGYLLMRIIYTVCLGMRWIWMKIIGQKNLKG